MAPSTLKRLVFVSLTTSTLSLGGCGVFLPGNIGGIAVGVTPEQYGERLCRDVDLEAYPACLSAVLDYFDEPRAVQESCLIGQSVSLLDEVGDQHDRDLLLQF